MNAPWFGRSITNAIKQSATNDGLTVDDPELGTHARVINLDLSTLDVIVCKIKMDDGSIGEITVKAQTLAQVIIDRTTNEINKQIETNEIQVGDGIGDGAKPEPGPASIDELIQASQRWAR